MRIQSLVLNFVRELISDILNIVGAVTRSPILLQNIFPADNFKGNGNRYMTSGNIVEGSTGITESLMKCQSVDSDHLSVVRGINCGCATKFFLIQQNKARAVVQAIRLGRLIFCQNRLIDCF